MRQTLGRAGLDSQEPDLKKQSSKPESRSSQATSRRVQSLLRSPYVEIFAPAILVAVLVAGTLWLVTPSASFFPALVTAAIWAPAVLGLSLLQGWAGLVSLGQAGIIGAAAYGTGIAASQWEWPFALAAIFGILVALALALVTSPILRIRGFYFALATLTLGTVIYQLLVALRPITGGAEGLFGIPILEIFGTQIISGRDFFILGWSIAIVGAVILKLLLRGRFGRAMKALRTSPNLASARGVPIARYRSFAWLVCSAYSGVAGVVYTYYSAVLSPEQFQFQLSVLLLASVMVFGAARVWLSLLGALLIFAGPQILQISSSLTHLFTALVLVAAAVMASIKTPSGPRPLRALRNQAKRMTTPTANAEAGLPVEEDSMPAWLNSEQPDDSPILELKDVHKRYGGLQVLKGVDLTVSAGTVQGLIGPNGAGKSSLVACVAGASPIDQGVVKVMGRDARRMTEDKLARQGLARTAQHPVMMEDETVLENVLLGTYTWKWLGPLGSLLRPWRADAQEARAKRIAMDSLDLCGCSELAGISASDLTAGQQRLVATAQAIAARPKLLILDEPAAGLSPTEAAALVQAIKKIKASGVSVLLIEHHVDFLIEVCDRVAALVAGRIIVNDESHVVMRHPDVVDAYLGTKNE